MRVNGKFVAALAMPLVTAASAAALLYGTHHTSLPSVIVPPAVRSVKTAKLMNASRCEHELKKPFTGVAVTSVSSSVVQDFNAATKWPVSIVEFYSPFPGTFNLGGALNAVRFNAIPLIQLNPGKLNKFAIRNIAAGRDNAKITAYANAVKKFKYCVIISFGHEMNGWWYHWGMPWNTPATFKQAWWNVHKLFAAAGAKNVIWSWDPSHQYMAVTSTKIAYPASKWYPGNKYVDWVGLDGYLGRDHNGNPQNFDEVFAPQVGYIRKVAARKLLYLAETSVAPTPDQLAQVKGLFAGILQDGMKGLIWFEQKQKQDWQLVGRPAPVIAAYSGGVSGYPKPQPVDVPQQ